MIRQTLLLKKALRKKNDVDLLEFSDQEKEEISNALGVLEEDLNNLLKELKNGDDDIDASDEYDDDEELPKRKWHSKKQKADEDEISVVKDELENLIEELEDDLKDMKRRRR